MYVALCNVNFLIMYEISLIVYEILFNFLIVYEMFCNSFKILYYVWNIFVNEIFLTVHDIFLIVNEILLNMVEYTIVFNFYFYWVGN